MRICGASNELRPVVGEVPYDTIFPIWLLKQVIGLTPDYENNVEIYIHHVGRKPIGDGLLGYLLQIPRFLWTMQACHPITTRIEELKLHTRDVGVRCQRYSVTVPSPSATANTDIDMYNDEDIDPLGEEKSLQRRALLFEGIEHLAEDGDVVRNMKTPHPLLLCIPIANNQVGLCDLLGITGQSGF